MLDLKFIRENPELVKIGAANKNEKCDIDLILKLDEERREIIRQVEQLKGKRNKATGEIAKKKKAGEPAEAEIAAMRQLGEQIGGLDNDLRVVDTRLHEALTWVPNLPHESAPVGKDEAANVVLREWGEKPKQDFKVLPHWEIGEKLDILDIPAATSLSGNGFYVLKGMGAQLHRALINYMLDMHTSDGYQEFNVPHIVSGETMFGTGQLPKLADDMYRIESDDLYLIPTGEVPLTNLFKNRILEPDELPVNIVAYTPCFRREAGAAGKDTRGMMRVHQFHKVELVKIVRPETSYDELDALLAQCEKVLQGLELPYRVCELATGDLSFAAAKCYDLELWASGVEKYLEISSVSNFESFQARRMKCRFRNADKKIEHPHTLNGSGLALARLIPAIVENYQNADGTITVPSVLRPYMKGAEKIS